MLGKKCFVTTSLQKTNNIWFDLLRVMFVWYKQKLNSLKNVFCGPHIPSLIKICFFLIFWMCNMQEDWYSCLNVFDDGAVLLRSIIWTLSVVLLFCNYNVSRDGSSLVIWNLLCWVRSIELASIGGPIGRFHLMTREEPSLETLWLQNMRTMDKSK
jgi:hypothetical protein